MKSKQANKKLVMNDIKKYFPKVKLENCYLHNANWNCLTFGVYLPIKDETYASFIKKLEELSKELNEKYGVPTYALTEDYEEKADFDCQKRWSNSTNDIWFTCAFN